MTSTCVCAIVLIVSVVQGHDLSNLEKNSQNTLEVQNGLGNPSGSNEDAVMSQTVKMAMQKADGKFDLVSAMTELIKMFDQLMLLLFPHIRLVLSLLADLLTSGNRDAIVTYVAETIPQFMLPPLVEVVLKQLLQSLLTNSTSARSPKFTGRNAF